MTNGTNKMFIHGLGTIAVSNYYEIRHLMMILELTKTESVLSTPFSIDSSSSVTISQNYSTQQELLFIHDIRYHLSFCSLRNDEH